MANVKIRRDRCAGRCGFGVEQIAPPQIDAQRKQIDNCERKRQPIPDPPAIDDAIETGDDCFEKLAPMSVPAPRNFSARRHDVWRWN